ncbi:MAG: outer membrane beta-barrel protein [Gemmatimonadetes bacterium]|nr:outer membrane beta-barrel protein [Gemmatimonadota bacterium]
MRITIAFLAAAALVAAPAALLAQDCDCDYEDEYFDKRPTGGYAGGSFTIARPQGEFRDYVDGGLGANLHYIHALDRDGWLAVRVDGGFAVYGYERQRLPLSPTLGGRILVDLTTSNDIAWIGVGPQIGVPDGTLKPYVNGYGGFSYLATTSSVEGISYYDDANIFSTTNFDDWSFSYGGGAGVYIPVRRGRQPVSIDLGVRYHNNGRAEYLREGGIQDNADGTITLFPVRSDTDLLTFHIGFSIGIAR